VRAHLFEKHLLFPLHLFLDKIPKLPLSTAQAYEEILAFPAMNVELVLGLLIVRLKPSFVGVPIEIATNTKSACESAEMLPRKMYR
jgi:hypothetical protein